MQLPNPTLIRGLQCSARSRGPTLARVSRGQSSRTASSSAKSNLKTELNIPGAKGKQPPPTETEKALLPWGEYLSIRKSKRRWETACSIPLTIGGFATGVAYFGNLEMDPTKPILGLDPMLVLGAATLGCAGFGYLMGPVVGSACWRLTHRRTMKLIEARDREFHQHIVKNRVDPTAQSATNPVPDFYGEKIGSLHEYRQWLRDQAKYKRKAYLPED